MIFERPPVRMGRDVAPTMNMMAVSGPPNVPLRLRDVFVTAFAGTLSWSVNNCAMKACLVGTSICEMLCLRNRNVTAPKNEPASGTRMRKTFDNKCVDTIVLRLPSFSARTGAAKVEKAVTTFTARKIAPRLDRDTL
jgi:hypothetical protein